MSVGGCRTGCGAGRAAVTRAAFSPVGLSAPEGCARRWTRSCSSCWCRVRDAVERAGCDQDLLFELGTSALSGVGAGERVRRVLRQGAAGVRQGGRIGWEWLAATGDACVHREPEEVQRTREPVGARRPQELAERHWEAWRLRRSDLLELAIAERSPSHTACGAGWCEPSWVPRRP